MNARYKKLYARFGEIRRSMVATNPPSTLFHYTDSSGLLGILQTRELWTTNAAFLNDATEISYTYRLFEELIDEEFEAAQVDGTKLRWLEREYLHQCRYWSSVTSQTRDFFVACFCEQGDLLSQWRGYTRSGPGYSIGFELKTSADAPTASAEVLPVVYEFERHSSIIADLVRAGRTHLQRVVAGDESEEAEKLAQRIALLVVGEVGFYAGFFKHPSFAEEHEWRVVVENRHPQFRTSDLGLTPYSTVPIGASSSDGMLRLVSVTVGPSVHQHLAERALERAVSQIGPGEVSISSSTVPLRP